MPVSHKKTGPVRDKVGKDQADDGMAHCAQKRQPHQPSHRKHGLNLGTTLRLSTWQRSSSEKTNTSGGHRPVETPALTPRSLCRGSGSITQPGNIPIPTGRGAADNWPWGARVPLQSEASFNVKCRLSPGGRRICFRFFFSCILCLYNGHITPSPR